MSETLLFSFLLLSKLELLVADLPEVSEVLLFLELIGLALVLAVNLQRARSFNGLLHFEFAALLLFVKTIGLILSLSNLLIQNLLLVVAEGSELLDLGVDHLLSSIELVLGTELHSVNSHLVHLEFLLSELFDVSLFLKFLLARQLGHSNLIGVGFHNVGLDTGGLFLALELSNLLALEVLLCLALNKFTLEHVFLELLDVVDLEFLELVADGLGVVHLFVVLALELGAHLGVVLFHFLNFEFFPVLLDVLVNDGLTGFVLALCILLFHHIRNEHLRLEGLDHVL